MKKLGNKFFGIGMLTVLLAGLAFAGGEEKSRRITRASQPLDIKITNWGPSQTDIERAKQRVAGSAEVQNALKGVKYRLLGLEQIESASADKSQPSAAPTRYRVFFYDYTNGKTIIAESDFAGREPITISEDAFSPGTNWDEIEAGFRIIQNDPEFAAFAKNNRLELYDAMPPVTDWNGERLVNIGVRNLENNTDQIVGISFRNDRVVKYPNNAPPTATAAPEACGITSAGQGSTGPGVAGQYQATVTQNGNPLWEMLIIRPSSSSGASNERSGIEVRDVKYKGKSVLKRGHAPILNVQYINNVCGPFRDWQYAEGFFQVPTAGTTYPNGTNGGIALVGAGGVATTAVETRNDSGNFQGVAVYQQDVGYGSELVLVTEMNAGWYRYIMEWRFAPDGTIRPRYGFGSTVNGCVCNPRNHHVYWRFDFDIVQPNNRIFQVERGRKFLRPLPTEAAIFRSYQLNRSFLVQNANGDEAYQITPGRNDGSVTNSAGVLTDTFGAGDFWFMQFKGTAAAPGEIDDPNAGSAANLAPWVNNESLDNQDVVVWYSAHQYRVDDTSRNTENVISGVHVVGPDLRPVRW